MDENFKKKINDELEKNEVCLFMKGTPTTPQCGFSREKAYTIVQKHAQNSWKNNMPLYESLIKDKMVVKKISTINLKKMFDLNFHTKNVNVIFKRIFK